MRLNRPLTLIIHATKVYLIAVNAFLVLRPFQRLVLASTVRAVKPIVFSGYLAA